MDLRQIIPEPEASTGIYEGDYKKDGLWYCGKCHEPKQAKVNFQGKSFVVTCLCACEKKRLEEEKQREQQKEEFERIEALKRSSLMPGIYAKASFKDYIHRKENEKAFRIATGYVKQFEQNEKNNYGLLFYGPVGTGKSYTAACMANTLLSEGVSVIMTSFVKILQDTQGMEVDEGKYIKALNMARLLIIDDLGAERSTDYALEKIYNVIDSRVRANKPMILTTNLKMAEMLKCEDLRLKRIYDRIFEVCLPVEMNGTSFRMERAATRQEAMQKYFKNLEKNASENGRENIGGAS